MKTPLDVAQISSFAISFASTTAFLSLDSVTLAMIFKGTVAGVGFDSLTEYSAVTVQGGLSIPLRFIRCQAAVQLL
jgi:hypothetical protein